MASVVVQTRVEKAVRDEASVVLESIGLNVSAAFRMFLMKVAKEKKMPFDPLVPNQTTIDAIKEARAGKLQRFDTVESLMADLINEDN